MQAGLPQQLDPRQLADASGGVSGTLAIDEMPRLVELLGSNESVVEYELNFSRHEQGWVVIEGDFSTCLGMECQRCLQAVDIEISQPVKVAIATDEAEARRLPGQFEPLILDGRVLSLKDFFEEELLLALPLAPFHNKGACARAAKTELANTELANTELANTELKSDDDRQNPFAVLKELKLKTSKD